MSAMSAFESSYARVVVRHDDPRELESKLTNRSFRIEIFHRLVETDSDSEFDEIVIEGSMGDTIHLLKSLGVSRMESAARLPNEAGELLVGSVSFNVADAVEHLKTDPTPLTCFVTDINRDEILKRVQLWQKERDDE